MVSVDFGLKDEPKVLAVLSKNLFSLIRNPKMFKVGCDKEEFVIREKGQFFSEKD